MADFELCEVRSYLNHVCLGRPGGGMCLCICRSALYFGTLNPSRSGLASLLRNGGELSPG